MFQLIRENKSADLHRLLESNKEIDVNVVESFVCDWTSNGDEKDKEVGKGTLNFHFCWVPVFFEVLGS